MKRCRRNFTGLFCALFFATPALAEVQYEGKALRDPFTDPAGMLTPKTDTDQTQNIFKTLKLQGILYSQESPRAIIDGKIVGAGDEVSGHIKVVAIHKGDVELAANDKTFILKETIRKINNDAEPRIADVKKN